MSLPKRAAPRKPPAPAAAPDATLASITRLGSLLPPAAAAGADLNPLLDLLALFAALPLTFPASATPAVLEANRQAVHAALHLLKSIFESLISQGRLHGQLKASVKRAKGLTGEAQGSGNVEAVKLWLRQRWTEYLERAVEIVGAHWDAGVRMSTLNALMSLLRTESNFLTSLHPNRTAQFASSTFALIVKGLLLPPDDELLQEDTREEWQKWFNKCDDVRFYFLKEATALVASHQSAKSIPPHLAANLLATLEGLITMPTASSELNEWWCNKPLALKASAVTGKGTGPPMKKRKAEEVVDTSTGVFDSSSESEGEAPATKLSSRDSKKLLPPLLSLAAHKRVFQDCWLALLSLPLNEAESKRVLVILHRQVLPHMTDPKRVMDWLVDSADAGGTIGILALNGLFTLMVKHNLEYPDFFHKLYSLLDREVLHVKYRPRFFRLLEIFMGSSHLPSAMVASFIKRLARLSLSAPPAGIVTVIPFIYNLLKLHPGCMMMIHRPAGTEEDEDDADDVKKDPFLSTEKDPLKTFAIESSLWELSTHRSHYSASVSGLAKIFQEVMNKQSYAMEDFLDHSYGTMLETEVTRKIRNAPALAPVPARQPIGDSFFPKTVEGTEEQPEPVDLVAKLWSF